MVTVEVADEMAVAVPSVVSDVNTVATDVVVASMWTVEFTNEVEADFVTNVVSVAVLNM
jgi:hypothetical protein